MSHLTASDPPAPPPSPRLAPTTTVPTSGPAPSGPTFPNRSSADHPTPNGSSEDHIDTDNLRREVVFLLPGGSFEEAEKPGPSETDETKG